MSKMTDSCSWAKKKKKKSKDVKVRHQTNKQFLIKNGDAVLLSVLVDGV